MKIPKSHKVRETQIWGLIYRCMFFTTQKQVACFTWWETLKIWICMIGYKQFHWGSPTVPGHGCPCVTFLIHSLVMGYVCLSPFPSVWLSFYFSLLPLPFSFSLPLSVTHIHTRCFTFFVEGSSTFYIIQCWQMNHNLLVFLSSIDHPPSNTVCSSVKWLLW